MDALSEEDTSDAMDAYAFSLSDALASYGHRILAPASGVPVADYGILGVVVLTLGLILAIEVLRHGLDKWAGDNPFFRTVLETMYRELTTLGIVEFCIYLMHKYQEDFNYQMEVIFVDVHFMLFYTAVFNAIQSCLVRLLVGRRTDRSWVQTENMDRGHYVGIRREFDRLQSKLNRWDATASVRSVSSHDGAEVPQSCWEMFRGALRDLAFAVQHPFLSRRMNQFLVVLRFHEIRSHFQKSNGLPDNFDVSPYLKRSLTAVMLDFVHISPAAWIMLMATVNLIFFVSGIMLNASKGDREVALFLSSLFYVMTVTFAMFALLLFFKMKSVFARVLRMRLEIVDPEDDVRRTYRTELISSTKTVDQEHLFFWGFRNHMFIVVMQYMQFGYALGLAMIFTYYKDFAARKNIHPEQLLLLLLFSYLIFLYFLSKIIPWYTLCTSMGHLVNKERLNETLAKLKLTEELRKMEEIEEEKMAKEMEARRKRRAEMKENAEVASRGRHSVSQISNSSFGASQKSHEGSNLGVTKMMGSTQIIRAFSNKTPDEADRKSWLVHSRRVQSRKKSVSDGVQFMSNLCPSRDLHILPSTSSSSTGSTRLSAAAAEQLCAVDEVRLQTCDERTSDVKGDCSSDDPSENTQWQARVQKTVSDGVALMMEAKGRDPFPLESASLNSNWPSPDANGNHAMSSKSYRRPRSNSTELTTTEITNKTDDRVTGGHSLAKSMPGRHERKQRRRVMKTQSEGVAFMRSSLSNELTKSSLHPTKSSLHPPDEIKLPTLSELTQIPTKDLPVLQEPSQSTMPRRGRRLRSNSAGVLSMREIPISNVLPLDDTAVGSAVAMSKPSSTPEPKVVAKSMSLNEAGAASSAASTLFADRTNSPPDRAERKQRRRAMKTQSEGVASMRSSLWSSLTRPSSDFSTEKTTKNVPTLPELNQTPTRDLSNLQENLEAPTPELKTVEKGKSTNETGAATSAAGTLFADQTNVFPLDKAERKLRRRSMKTQSEGVAFMRSSLSSSLTRPPSDFSTEKAPDKLPTLPELTQTSTRDLSNIPESPESPNPGRRSRRRRSSTGVLSMRTGLHDGLELEAPLHDSGIENTEAMLPKLKMSATHAPTGQTELMSGRHERKQRRRAMKTQSEGVAFMRSSFEEELTGPIRDSAKAKEYEALPSLSELSQITTKDLPEIEEKSQTFGAKRRPRLKSSSAGVAFMRGGTSSDADSARTAPMKVSKDAAAGNIFSRKEGEMTDTGANDTSPPGAPVKSRVRFSLLATETIAPALEPSLDVQDDASILSLASDDSVESNLPEALHGERREKATIINKVEAFFRGSKYRTMSLLFGPMACFFLVALRVEIFSIYAGYYVDQTDVWKNMLVPSFWIELSIYCAMTIEMLSAIAVFIPKGSRFAPQRGSSFHCIAAMLGLLINVTCLSLLLIAEVKRCCHDDGSIFVRMLGPSQSKGYYDTPAAEEPECCPAFGQRRYGGLGPIEPFTCLVALSPLRHFVAGGIVKLLGLGSGDDMTFHSHEGEHSHHHGPDPTLKVRELWTKAVGVHSVIANKFGPFSGHLLQCMLGIYIESDNKGSERTVAADPGGSDYDNKGSERTSAGDPEGSEYDASTACGSSRHHERENSMDMASVSSSRGISSPGFIDNFGLSLDNFAYPNARLKRRMRRCQRRLPPLMNEWMVVDVVLTGHELVLFDVCVDTEGSKSMPDYALPAGGRELKLCEVAEGRKIVDQFDLDDVDFVDIGHFPANPSDAEDVDIENKSCLLEYWEGATDSNVEDYADIVNERWGRVDEDRLQIRFKNKTAHDTLFLRFMADLKEMEQNRKDLMADTDLMHHVGTQSKKWCATVARLRGSMNLKQNLPHFGDGGDGELEDFVRVCERDLDKSHRTRRVREKFHRRRTSRMLTLSTGGGWDV